MLKSCPDPVDVQDLQFKLHCRLKVFNNTGLATFHNSQSLISCASRYGLLFVGSNSSNLQAIQLKCIENYSPKDKDISNYPRRNITLSSPPKHVCVNCDSTVLAVVVEKDKCSVVVFYDVLSFLKQNITVITEARLSPTPGVHITEINWNPAIPPIFTACKSDGTLGVYEIKGNSIDINELPSAAEATSFCWSPKGKQLAVGSRNGKITQYKPDLKAVKVVNEPPLGGPYSLISLQWVSNYQFIGIYQSVEPESSAKLIVIDAPKVGEPSYTNYEDVCYSGSTRPPQFYMILQQHWNLLMVASSNSTEVGVLGSAGDSWTQWILPDSARAELPLSPDHQETLPVGLALDISSTKPLPWNETSIPPCPYLLILSHQGILCLFNIINLKQGIPSICTPPDPVSDMSGVGQFTTTSDNISAPQSFTGPTFDVKSPAFSFAPAQSTVSQVPTLAPAFGPVVLTQPQPTNTTISSSLFGARITETKPLFGGQAILAPINPQQPATQASIFGGQTLITPVNKPQVNITTSNTAVGDKYSSIFSALNAPTPTPAVSQSKPIVISTRPAAKTELPAEQQVVVQPKASIITKTVESLPAVDIKINETDPLLAQMVKDECISLESELKAVLHQGRLVKINIGSDAEKLDMISKITSLQEFIKEIVDISIGENAEVHYLKQNLIQSWAWFEEARSRYNASKDETMSLLLRAQPLDSATDKRQTDIRKLIYYIDSQIMQASKAIDEQWDNFQDYARKTHRAQMPTMEAIFQAMVRQNAIIQKQAYVMKDIASRLKNKTRSTSGPSLLVSMEDTEDLEADLKRLQLLHPQDIYQIQYERVLNRMKNLSVSKTQKLRHLLKRREIVHVTAVKPQFSSSLMMQSPTSKKLVSDLQISRISKTGAFPKSLSFLHSTPIRETKIEAKSPATPPNTPQIDPKTFSFKKVENSSSALNLITTASNFVPLSRATSAFSNLPQGHTTQATLPTHNPSAFVPTTQVSFGTNNKPFSFAPVATTTSTVQKIMPVISIATTSSSDKANSALPKFFPVMPKTTSSVLPTSNTVATSTPTVKTSLPQFGFGSNISITPVSAAKTVNSASTTTASVVSTKPTFSFNTAASNVFGTKVNVDSTTTNKTETPISITSNAPLFSALSSQGNKTLFGIPTTSSGTFTFGAVSSTPKASAFTAVTTSTTSITPTTTVVSVTTTSISAPKTELTTAAALTQPSLFVMNPAAVNTSAKTTASIFSNLASSTSTPITVTTASLPILGSSISSTTTPSSVSGASSTATTSMFGSSTISTKPSSIFNTNLTSATQAAGSSSGLPIFSSVTASTSAKPLVISTPATTSSETSIFTTTTAAATTSSVFAVAPPTNTTASTTTAQSLLFGGTQSPVVDSTNTTGLVTTAQGTSVFGSSNTSSTTKPPPFGTTVSSTQPSIFGLPGSVKTSQTSIFGGTSITTQSSIFGTASTAAASKPSIFGTAVTSTQPSIFGANTATTAQQGSVFGTNTSANQTAIFGTASAGSSSQNSIFGGVTPSSTTQPSIFGGATPSSTTQPSIFGGATSSSTTQPSIFGAATSVSTTQPSIFGGATTASTTKPSIFGATTSTPTTQASIFAVSSAPSTPSSLFHTASAVASPFGSGFGSTPTGTTSSPFGQPNTAFGAPNTTASPFGTTFGSPTVFGSTPATTSSVFGQPASFGNASTSVFGTPTTSTNIFGSTASGPTFGAVNSTNAFGTTPVCSSSFSFAGAAGNTTNAGAFGFGGLNVGNAATTSSSIFGGGASFGQSNTAPPNPFGRATEEKPAFGASTNLFGTPSTTSNSIFGSNAGSAFGSTSQSSFGTSTFGSSSTFGGQQPPFGQSSFGNTSFGSPQPGPFSGGSSAVGQSGFGSAPSFQKPPGFGAAPVFGGSPPAFGAAPSFGGSPAFGSAPAFGSPDKVFGSNAPTGGFGAAASGSPGFGNIANQNTVGFGNLAQQAATSSATPFSGPSPSFSSWR